MAFDHGYICETWNKILSITKGAIILSRKKRSDFDEEGNPQNSTSKKPQMTARKRKSTQRATCFFLALILYNSIRSCLHGMCCLSPVRYALWSCTKIEVSSLFIIISEFSDLVFSVQSCTVCNGALALWSLESKSSKKKKKISSLWFNTFLPDQNVILGFMHCYRFPVTSSATPDQNNSRSVVLRLMLGDMLIIFTALGNQPLRWISLF